MNFSDARWPLAAFPLPDSHPDKSEPGRAGTPDGGGHHARMQERKPVEVDSLPVSGRIKNLIRGINDPEHPYHRLFRRRRRA
jgi:hypothetical protein